MKKKSGVSAKTSEILFLANSFHHFTELAMVTAYYKGYFATATNYQKGPSNQAKELNTTTNQTVRYKM